MKKMSSSKKKFICLENANISFVILELPLCLHFLEDNMCTKLFLEEVKQLVMQGDYNKLMKCPVIS